MTQADQPWRPGRARRNTEEQVVASGSQLGRPKHLDLEPVPLRDPRRLLGKRFRCQLVRRRVLPFTRPVGGLTVLLCGDDLVLAAEPKAGQDELFDFPPLRLRAGLPRASLESAHDAAFDDGFQGVHGQGRVGTDKTDALVAVGA